MLRDALDAATRAIEALTATSAGFELESARSARGWALVHQNRWAGGRARTCVWRSPRRSRLSGRRSSVDIAAIHSALGDRVDAEALIARAADAALISDVVRDMLDLTRAEIALRTSEFAEAQSVARLECRWIDLIPISHSQLAREWLARSGQSRLESPDAPRWTAAAVHLAARQGARLYLAPARILQGVLQDEPGFATAVEVSDREDPGVVVTRGRVRCGELRRLSPAVTATCSR